MDNIYEKKYAAFIEENLQHMIHMPVDGICILIRLEDGSVYSDYYNSSVTDKMVYAGVVQQDITWSVLKSNNAVGKEHEETNE